MNDRYAASRAHFDRSQAHLAGGVGSTYRAGQLPIPITMVRGRGPYLTDIDGNEYIDFLLSFGPLLLGHSPEPVVEAIRRQLEAGLTYGTAHTVETELAEAVCRTVPCAELAIFSSSGTEAVNAAVRVARAATGRNRLIKFHGHYHGWSDPLHIGTPGHSPREPGTGGQDPGAAECVSVLPWNDLDALKAELGSEVAAVIMEPFAVNGGAFAAAPGYLEAVRELTRANDTVLIFDEVITGYRLALGGAQERFGITPDLAVLGKALGNGLPIVAVCGRADILDVVVKARVGHAGTFNTNPIPASAALAAVTELERRADEIYPHLELMGGLLSSALRDAAAEHDLPLQVNQLGAAGHAFWSEAPIEGPSDVGNADFEAFRRFAEALLDEGVHVSSRGILYVSTAHSEADLVAARAAIFRAAERMKHRVPATEGTSATPGP
jgi:glutamate-1-semialdehyde 2,1-aminomutase